MNGLNNNICQTSQTLPLDLLVCIGRFLDIQTRQNFLLSCKALYNRRARFLFDPKASKFGGTMKDFLLIMHEYGCEKILTSLRSLTFYNLNQKQHCYYLFRLVCDLNAIKSFVVNKLVFKNSDIQNINIFFKINNLTTLDVSGIKKNKIYA